MGVIYRRRVAEGNADRREDKRHGVTETNPARGARFGRIWWVRSYCGGKPFYESSGSPKKTVAENLSKRRQG